MSKKKSVDVEVHLDYFKQGDDLQHYLTRGKTPEAAFRALSDQMRFVVEHLDKLADKIKGKKVKIDAMAHMIMITCGKELA